MERSRYNWKNAAEWEMRKQRDSAKLGKLRLWLIPVGNDSDGEVAERFKAHAWKACVG
jgi:hypothetical protein